MRGGDVTPSGHHGRMDRRPDRDLTTELTERPRRLVPLRPAFRFRTPVRGYAFAPRPPGADDPAPGEAAELRREPDNPADPYAVAVWAGSRARRWRIGYLERAVAARVAPRLDDELTVAVRARVDGWWDEPEGRWRRPVVLVELDPAPSPSGVWGRPAESVTRPVRAPGLTREADVSR